MSAKRHLLVQSNKQEEPPSKSKYQESDQTQPSKGSTKLAQKSNSSSIKKDSNPQQKQITSGKQQESPHSLQKASPSEKKPALKQKESSQPSQQASPHSEKTPPLVFPKSPPSQQSSVPPKKQATPPSKKSAPASLKSSDPQENSRQTSPKKISAGSLTKTQQQQSGNSKILGIDKDQLIHIGIIATVVIIIIFILYKLYKRYQTRKDYNESPQNFPNKPVLGFVQQKHLNDCKIQACLTPQSITIQQKHEVIGKGWKVEFKGTQKSAIYFHRRQNTTTYFQIQLLSVNGTVEMGYVPVNCFDKIKNGEESIGNSGVGVTNAGYVQAEGENLYNYGWSLIYGDVFGMGITQNSKFSQRRAWISKNGVLLNTPPNDELGRWLATIDISPQQKAQFNLGTQNKSQMSQKAPQQQQDEQKLKEKAQRQKIEGLLKKQRISLKTFNKFEYYPVIYFYGNKSDSKSTVININVGGQIFRMNDAQFRSGLLKTPNILFGDD